MEKSLFEKIKINDILIQYYKNEKDVNIHKVTDIDDDTVYTCVLFTLDFYSDLSYFHKEDFNNPVYEFHFLSELNEKEIEELKNLVFNNIIYAKTYWQNKKYML